MRSGSTNTSGSPGSTSARMVDPRLLGRGAVDLDRHVDQRARGRAAAVQLDRSRLDARQVEQLVDDDLQRSQSSRAANSRSACLGVSGPTASSVHRCNAMRSDVSGVRNSCATVATRSFFSSSKRNSRVMSWSTIAAPADRAVLAVDRRRRAAGRPLALGRRARRAPPPRTPSARTRPCPPARGARSDRPARAPRDRRRRTPPPLAFGVDRQQRRRRRVFAPCSLPVPSSSSTGSASPSIAACAACCACSSSPSELAR